MLGRGYFYGHWRLLISSFLLISLCASTELTKDELLAKIENCNSTITRLEAEMKAVMERGGTQQEIDKEVGIISDQFPVECQMQLCNQMKAQVDKELAEAKASLTNPDQSELDKLKKEIEVQYPLEDSCGDEGDGSHGDGHGTKTGGDLLANITKGNNDMSGNYVETLTKVLKDVDASTLMNVMTNQTALGSLSSNELSLYGEELVQKLGGARKIKLADIKDMGPVILKSILPGEYKYLSDDVFEYILNQIYEQTTIAVKNEFESLHEPVDYDAVSADILQEVNSAKIKALCGRAFRLYRTSKQINDGWNNIKFLMFCAPPRVCKHVNNDLIQKDLNTFGYQPWTCKAAKLAADEDKQSQFHDYLVRTYDSIETTRKLFPSNKPCGKILAEKLVTGGTSPLHFKSLDDVSKLRYMTSCIPDSTFRKAIDDIGCEFGGEMYKTGALSQKMTRYTAKMCLSAPPNPENVTCASLEANYKPYLKEIKRSFFKSLPPAVMCDTQCMELFKQEEEFPSDVMKYITKSCYKDSATISSDDVKNLGGLVTDLPIAKFDQISAADLQSNIKAIKTDLKTAKTKGGGRKNVVKKLAKKMLSDGKVSNLIDSKEIMKEVSLKDLKASLSESDDIIVALGINDTQDTLGFTDSQKKWVIKQVVKKKEAGSFSLDDIKGMKSLVTGLLSLHIKKIGEAHTTDTNAIAYAVEMCAYPNWPRKSLEAINKHLIQTTLNARNAADPMSALTNFDVQTLGCQCLLNFNTALYEKMDTEVCSAVCMKIGYCDIFRCLNPIRRKNVLQACLKCKGLGSNVMTNTDFEELGPNLVSQLSEAQLDLVPAEVLQTHVEFFKDICMDQSLRNALSEALMNVIGSSGTDYDADTLYLLGSAIKVLPSTLQKDLDKNVIAEMQSELMGELVGGTEEEINLRKCCEKWLDTADLTNLKEQNFNLMLTIKEAFFANVESKRRRRAAIFKWTCRQIRALPVLFATASAKQIDIMDNQDLLDCLEIIGNIKKLRHWQQAQLFAKAQKAIGQKVCTMSIEQINEFGVINLAIHVHDIRCLPLNDMDLVAFLGSLDGWKPAQLSALANRYMELNNLSDLSALTSENVTMLGPILCGFPVNQLVTMPSAVFRKSGKDIGSMKECSTDQFAVFVSLAVQYDAYGPINTWDADDVSELKYIIAGLSGIEIKELSISAIEGLDPVVIPLIPRNVLQNMRLSRFQSFTAEQASAVTTHQRNGLSQENNNSLDRILGQDNDLTRLKQTSAAGNISPLFCTVWWLLQLVQLFCVTSL